MKTGQLERDEQMKRDLKISWLVALLDSDIYSILSYLVVIGHVTLIILRSAENYPINFGVA
jgi:hypothetical protein